MDSAKPNPLRQGMTWQRGQNFVKLLSVLKVCNFIEIPLTIVSQRVQILQKLLRNFKKLQLYVFEI